MKKNKIFHLKTCNTCQRIIGELGDVKNFDIQNIKEEHITKEELEFLAEQAGSYEALFNRRAQKYRSQGLNEKTLTEAAYKKLILGEYTFLKRPVIVYKGEAFIGNSKKVVAAAIEKVQG